MLARDNVCCSISDFTTWLKFAEFLSQNNPITLVQTCSAYGHGNNAVS